MKSKVVSWFFILMMLSGMILIFSPDSVTALDPVTFENWDSYTVGTTSGTTIYGSWENDVYNKYSVTNVWSYSGTNSLRNVKPEPTNRVWYNFTETYDYISNVTLYGYFYYKEGINTDTANHYIYTKNDSLEVNKIHMYGSTSGAQCDAYFYVYDYDSTAYTLYSAVNVENEISIYWKLIITHNGLNFFNYSLYDSTDDSYIHGVDISGRNAFTHTTIDQLFFTAVGSYHHGTSSNTFHIDNVVFARHVPGNTTINVYNESSPSTAIPDWSLRIYDTNNVIHYSKNNLDNPVTVNHSVYGTGGMFFEISATGYYNRTYYADIRNGIHYVLDAFLPNSDDANLYTCIVVDDSDLDHIIYINDATIVITRFINGSVHEISSGFTDGSGRYYVPLIPDVTYTVNITATGYDDLQDTYIPSSSVFEQTFRMASSSPTSTTYDDFWENISIDISMVSAGCMQDGNITITYLDSNSSTTNTEIRLWEIYGTTNTLLNTWTNTSNSFFNINSSINTTRVHYMSLYFNNTAFFPVSQPMNIMIPNVDSPFCDRVEPFDLDDRITKIVGPFTIEDRVIPWTIIIGTFVPIIFLVAFGPFNTGLGIIGCGLSMTMIQGFLDMYVSGGFQWGIVGIGAFIVILGILYIMTKGTGGDHL